MNRSQEIDVLTTLVSLARERETSFCPSEVARRVAPTQWRQLMPVVREIAAHLTAEGLLGCTQRGTRAHPLLTRGAIRLRRGRL